MVCSLQSCNSGQAQDALSAMKCNQGAEQAIPSLCRRTQAGLGAPALQRGQLGAQRDGRERVGVAELVGGEAVQLHALAELVRLGRDQHGALAAGRQHGDGGRAAARDHRAVGQHRARAQHHLAHLLRGTGLMTQVR